MRVRIQSSAVEGSQYFNSPSYSFIFEMGDATNESVSFQLLSQSPVKAQSSWTTAAAPSAALISAHPAPHQLDKRLLEEMFTFAESAENLLAF